MIDGNTVQSSERTAGRGELPIEATSGETICVLATLPPPVTGMNVVTAAVVDVMRASRQVVLHNWSNGRPAAKWRWRLSKAIRSVCSVLYLMKWRQKGFKTLYTVANSGGGLYYNLLVISVARLLNFRCFLHHHVFAYINRFDWRMKLMVNVIGDNGTQIFLAPEMQSQFEHVYGNKSPGYVLSNIFLIPPALVASDLLNEPGIQSSTCLTLGHLSNLTLDKGLGRVISTFEMLVSRSLNVRLILAGPVSGKAEQELIKKALAEHGARMEYRGAVYGEDKVKFFEAIDVFLFPTAYKNEAQPLVVAEALNAGKPVIAYARACIPSLVGAKGGLVIPCDQEFAPAASERIREWIENPDHFNNAVRLCREHMEQLRCESEDGIQRLISLMSHREITA